MSAPIRILHVIDSFDLGGAQEVVVNLIAGADRRRFAPEVATLHGHGVYEARLKALGVPVYSLSPHKFLPLYVPRLLWLMLRRGYGVVHCHLIASNLVAKPLAALCGVPVRFNHDQTNDEYRYRDTLRLALDTLTNRLSTHICAVSVSIVDFLRKYERVPAERVSLVYNAIDLKRFTPAPDQRATLRARWNLPADGPVIAGIGRLNYQKNFPLFLQIAAELRRTHPQATFVLAGSGPEDAALKAQAAALGLKEAVRFLGFVADTAQLYPAIDFLLMPSRFEGLPMTLLEAMAMEVPVVASRLDGIAEILEDGRDGRLAAPDRAEEFVAHLRTLLNQPDHARILAINAAEKVRRQFSAEHMVQQVEALYDRYLP